MVKDILELMKTNEVPIQGFFLVLCALLLFVIRWQNKEITNYKKEAKEKDEMIISLMEKYYVISTKTQSVLEKVSNYLIKNNG